MGLPFASALALVGMNRDDLVSPIRRVRCARPFQMLESVQMIGPPRLCPCRIVPVGVHDSTPTLTPVLVPTRHRARPSASPLVWPATTSQWWVAVRLTGCLIDQPAARLSVPLWACWFSPHRSPRSHTHSPTPTPTQVPFDPVPIMRAARTSMTMGGCWLAWLAASLLMVRGAQSFRTSLDSTLIRRPGLPLDDLNGVRDAVRQPSDRGVGDAVRQQQCPGSR